jgi:hypothetical protein
LRGANCHIHLARELAGNFYMKVTRIFTVALMASAMAASADSIEQFLNISVTGWYQGLTIAGQGVEHQLPAPIHIGTLNIVRALAVDFGKTNFFTGRLVYKTPLDGSTNQFFIREAGTTNELDVTSAFTFGSGPGPVVVNELANTNRSVTNFYQETNLRFLSFSNSSMSFSNGGFCIGSTTRTRQLPPIIGTNGTLVTGFANTLLYSNGVGTFMLNTNIFFHTNFQFAATNLVSGPAQIDFQTFAPFVSRN